LLFDYRVSASEFPALREEQQLCFEFSRLPNSVTRLLATCQEHDGFRAVLDERHANRSFLQLQQTTKFSLITHLKLPLVAASDDRLKSYLSDEAKRFKAAFEMSVEEVEKLRNELSCAAEDGNARSVKWKREIDRIRQEHNAEMEAMRRKFEKALDKDRRRASEAAAQQTAAFDQKEGDLIKASDDQIKDLQTRLDAVTSERSQLAAASERHTERLSSLEAQLADARERLRTTDDEMKALQQAHIESRTESAAIKGELAATAEKLESAVAALQEKAAFSAAQGSQIESLRSQLCAKDDQIAKMQQTIAELSEQAKDRNWIAEKSKKVIAKHQDDIRKLIQHHNDRKAEWERKAEEMKTMERENVRCQEQIKALELALRSADAKCQDAIARNEELSREIERIQDERKVDRHMIGYLEGELNRKGDVICGDDEDDHIQAQSPKGFKPPTKGGPFSPYVPKMSYPETGSVFDSATFFV
jgi:predicted  nucleic acid-binding Zn-ribbon protein